MTVFLRWLVRVVIVLALAAAGFCLGTVAGYKICMWWVVPGWVKQYPHDGQLGLGVMAYAAFGGIIGAAIATAAGIAWMILAAMRKKERVAESQIENQV